MYKYLWTGRLRLLMFYCLKGRRFARNEYSLENCEISHRVRDLRSEDHLDSSITPRHSGSGLLANGVRTNPAIFSFCTTHRSDSSAAIHSLLSVRPYSCAHLLRTVGPIPVREFVRLKISIDGIKLNCMCNLLSGNELSLKDLLAREVPSSKRARCTTDIFASQNNTILTLTMKVKVALAHWFSLRIQEQTRRERRALRDYSRQELGAIRQAEKRSRGLRLYAAWSRRPAAKFTRSVAAEWPTPFEHAA